MTEYNGGRSVYLLLASQDYRDTDICGVYATRDLAESAKDELTSQFHPYDHVYIQEEKVLDGDHS